MMAFARRQLRRLELAWYLRSDRRPWRRGYLPYRTRFLTGALSDEGLLERFRRGDPLPEGYGYRLDARSVELPWLLSQLGPGPLRMLDAGSSLNHAPVLDAPAMREKELTIVTLAPEAECFWRRGISYLFGDLRDLVLRDESYDAVACISTIEHVGMDNRMYAGEEGERDGRADFTPAVRELWRVLRPGGTLFISFPFGRYENHGWFQQFDSALLQSLVDAFQPSRSVERVYRYQPTGWQISSREACADCEFFDVRRSRYLDATSELDFPDDFPAGERAVACLVLVK